MPGRTGSSVARRSRLLGAILAVIAPVLVAPAEAAAPAPDRAAWLYRPNHVTRIDLRLPPASRKALAREPDEYVRAGFRLTRRTGATYGPLTIGVKLKGHTSFRPLSGKAAFKFKFGEYVEDQTFQGLETMVLNNMVQDPSMLRELLAYKAFRVAGLAAWRAGYSFLRIDDRAYGVYLNLESPDKVSVARWHPSTGHLYEGGSGVDFVPGSAPKFEAQEGDEDDLRDLEALIAAVTDWKDVDAVADLRQMTRFWAVEKYTGHWDGYSGRLYPNNFYVHSDAGGRFTMLPWGTDQTWSRRIGYGDPGGLLFNRCLADNACAALFRQAVDDVRASLNRLDLAGLAARTARLLSRWQRRDPRREQTLRQVRRSVAAVKRYVIARRTDTTWLSSAGR